MIYSIINLSKYLWTFDASCSSGSLSPSRWWWMSSCILLICCNVSFWHVPWSCSSLGLAECYPAPPRLCCCWLRPLEPRTVVTPPSSSVPRGESHWTFCFTASCKPRPWLRLSGPSSLGGTGVVTVRLLQACWDNWRKSFNSYPCSMWTSSTYHTDSNNSAH